MAKKTNILFVVGTRPEIIKTAPVIQELKKRKHITTGVCLSGQHTSMVDQMLRDFKLDLDFSLKIMEKGQTLTTISKNLIPKLERVYKRFKPDVVFVQGDTTTAFTAAFVAFYNRIKVCHIEAGLRTFDRYFPFPEEINRSLITRLANRHYAPTPAAKKNLIAEGVPKRDIVTTGNTCIDALKYMAGRKYPFVDKRLNKLEQGKRIILLTVHRRENFGRKIKEVFSAVRSLAKEYEDIVFIYPVHPNPNVKKPANRMLSGRGNIVLLGSLQYRDLVKVMKKSYLILTDSGGIQEEAPSLGKPVLVLRDKTERPEAVIAGSAKVVGTETPAIVSEMKKLLKGGTEYRKMSVTRNVFGKGDAAKIICRDVAEWLKGER